MDSTMDKRYITNLRLSIITLQHDKVKDCDRHPPQYVLVQIGKPRKDYVKGADPNDSQFGGALVVVRGGENSLHGKGA